MIADEFTQLVFHVLAHLRLEGPGTLHDPRYLGWAGPRFEPEQRRLLEHDADLLTRLWNANARYDRLHGFCELHHDWAGFIASVGRSLSELGRDDVADLGVLETVHSLDGAELLHATLALISPSFHELFVELGPTLADADAELCGWIDRLASVCPGLADARIESVWALGMHGRGLSSRILVGAPAAWSECSAARQAVLAAHELAVARVGTDDYVADEWTALTELAGRLRDAEPELRAAHRDWLASLELAPLTRAAVARGYLDPRDAAALLDEPSERADRLSAARAAASC